MINISNQEEVSTSLNTIFDEHDELLGIIDKLNIAINEQRSHKIIGIIIDDLETYALAHFETEEKYFDVFGFLNKEAHILGHKELIQQILSFKKKFFLNNVNSSELLDFLQVWFVKYLNEHNEEFHGEFKMWGRDYDFNKLG